MEISFQSESDHLELVEATHDYQELWKNEGERMVNSIQKITGLSFAKDSLDASIVEGIRSQSHPLKLCHGGGDRPRRRILMHELTHIILDDNKVEVEVKEGENSSFINHMLLDLVLFDILFDFYGGNEEIAQQHVDREKIKSPQYYSDAWDWALSKTREERRQLFGEAVKNKKFTS